MLERIIRISIGQRWLVMAMTMLLIAIGVWSFNQLSIDATPDITNVQCKSIRLHLATRLSKPNSG